MSYIAIALLITAIALMTLTSMALAAALKEFDEQQESERGE